VECKICRNPIRDDLYQKHLAMHEAAATLSAREEAAQSPAGAFHKHLDTCPVCRSQPFNLCSKGARLLGAAI